MNHPIEEAMAMLGVQVRPRFEIRDATEKPYRRIQVKTPHLNWSTPGAVYLRQLSVKVGRRAERIEHGSASDADGVVNFMVNLAKDMSWPIAPSDITPGITQKEREKLKARSSLDIPTQYGNGGPGVEG